MKTRRIFASIFLIAIALAFLMPVNISAQDNPTQDYSKSNTYVKITWDTTDFTASPYLRTEGLQSKVSVTNQSTDTYIECMLSRATYGNGRDSSTYFRVPPGKTAKFTTKRRKLFRRALSSTAADSLKSQVILGEIQIGYNGSNNEGFITAAGTNKEYIFDSATGELIVEIVDNKDFFEDCAHRKWYDSGYRTKYDFDVGLQGDNLKEKIKKRAQ